MLPCVSVSTFTTNLRRCAPNDLSFRGEAVFTGESRTFVSSGFLREIFASLDVGLKFLRAIAESVPRVRIHRVVCNGKRERNAVSSSARSRPLIFSRGHKIDWPIASMGISLDRLTAKRDRITGQSTAGIKHSFARVIRPACLRFVDNKSLSGARAMVLQMAPSLYQSFPCRIKTAISHRVIYQIIK